MCGFVFENPDHEKNILKRLSKVLEIGFIGFDIDNQSKHKIIEGEFSIVLTRFRNKKDENTFNITVCLYPCVMPKEILSEFNIWVIVEKAVYEITSKSRKPKWIIFSKKSMIYHGDDCYSMGIVSFDLLNNITKYRASFAVSLKE